MIPASFAAALDAAAERAPMTNGSVATVPGRLLMADGDGLCYYCAGGDETSAGQARANLISKLESAQRACGAERVKIVVTARDSHKGFRYAVSRVKPYQGHRDGGRRPKNWEYLRSIMDTQEALGDFEIERTAVAEADDLFARYALHHPDCVIYTQDKDMRMIPGMHLDWLTHITVQVPAGCWSMTMNDKMYGRKWFWLQLLMGDAADNVPGLPKYATFDAKGKPALKLVGEKTAEKLLEGVLSDMGALIQLRTLYEGFYNERWMVELLEQGILLWMRNDQASSPFNVTAEGNPFAPLTGMADWPTARAEIMARIAEAVVAEAEDHGHRSGAGSAARIPEGEMRPVPAPDDSSRGGAGSRPLDGGGQGDPAPIVQCPVGQDRERVQALRREEPRGVPSWGRLVLAKARNSANAAPAPDAQVA